MQLLLKKIILSFTLASFLMIAIFSLQLVMHTSDGSMSSDCPLSAVGALPCPLNIVASLTHHISAYESILLVPLSTHLTNVLVSLLLITGTALLFLISPPLLGAPVYIRTFENIPRITPYERKVIHWLSLFENSPSLT